MSNLEKRVSAKKYFIYAFKRHILNENKVLYKKFLPSLREVLLDYIDIYEDINQNIDNKKLENAKKDILKTSMFFIKESIFYKKGIYKEELDFLINDMKDIVDNKLSAVAEVRTYNKCKSIVKKISNDNIYKHLANIVKDLTNFAEIDRAIEGITSEMLYDNYSLKYIENWYKINVLRDLNNLDEEKIDGLIDKFKYFSISEKEYKYYLTIKSQKSLGEKIYLDCNLVMNIEEFENITLINDKDGKDAKSYLQQGQFNHLYSVVVKCRDYYKGLEILIDSLNSYFQIIEYLNEDIELAINEKIVVEIGKNKYEKLRKNIYDDAILFSKSERRELEDIRDFIEYRDKVYLMNIGHDEIANIQRAINIIKGQKAQTKENRLINLWSVLEYMLTFHNGDSIISKVKDIVPKVYCLYLIKDKINTFWNILYQYKESGYGTVTDMIANCKLQDDEYRYDLGKLIEYINRKGKQIIEDLEFNDMLKRAISEIGTLFFSDKERIKYIEQEYKKIEMDLIRIYRDRNILIHSGRREIRNINYKTLRLYQYNNNILGVVIYYKKNNPTLTIEEILNSIEYTYDKYVSIIKNQIEPLKLIDICRPKYLFIE
ncbi:hypothetical protein IO99_13260 [Clostridium sulfidigenes]|uniref:Apea-like HEPN domain-containing protein n=1 Tax=Clostridium sulfidigenes TaxID=318464 RepID=A0A084J9K4_9CLOT|nr:hypothetical protein [Clostridium sulfidigenes]KEZ85638.1 hypothetical protein IO99_13260 [Clostridium sulfidigenes]